ncbi:uncharacterized protein [Polyergus mexicanus]|uniref:uncharacterized protein n=1 Tax=Polyergus mexicanus TaxID=615972 RepID=UPI0038B6A8DF
MEARDLLDSARDVATGNAYRAWARRCDECLESLRERCRGERRGRSTGAINSLIARIVRLTGARDNLRRRFERVGGGVEEREGFSWSEIETAFSRRVLTGAVINFDYIEPRRFLEDARDTVLDRIRDVMNEYNGVKVNTVFVGEFVSGDKIDVKTIVTKNYPLLPLSDSREWYEKRVVDATLTSLEEFQERDSGWALSRIFNLTVNVNRYNPMHAGCRVKLPREIALKKAVINVQSNDNACFAWAVVAALYPAEKNVGRESSYPHYTTVLNLKGVKFPMSLNKITRFERINDISINVYTVRDKKEGKNGCRVVPLRLTDDKKNRHVNLLYFDDMTRRDDATHFAWIKNLSRLVGSQLSGRRHKSHICDRCMHYFRTSDKLSAHSVDCGRMNECAIVLPTKDDKWLEFRNYSRKERLPFVVYADLECVLKKKEERRTSNTSIVQHHEVYSAGYYARCALDGVSSTYRAYRGENCVLWFVRELHDLALRAKTVLDIDAPMTNLTSDEWERFVNATRCSICEKPFELGDARVRDHCHLTGRYRGPAHSNCNLNYKDTYVIPVFFHNLSGYDAHFIIKDVANAFPGSVEILPITKETYISFTKNVEDAWDEGWFGKRLKLRFVDSFKFLSASLEKLASYLDKSEVRIARSEFSDLSDADFELLARKGVFPYEYVDDVDKFYNLDPAYYYTLPGYTWDAMLKYTSVRFELLTDIDMVMFVERGIRGGLSQCSNRYARANNKYLQSYDSSEPSSYLMYFDINNLYGWAMCQSLPYENFRWVDNVTSVDLMSVTSDSPIGYILEVDLAYPSDLHDSHADLPFCPTRDKPPGKRDEKLLATLYDKNRYVIYYRNLQQCVRHGLRITKIHRILRFAQSSWLRNHSNVRLVTRWDGRYGAEAMIAKPNFHSRSVFAEDLVAVELRKLEIKFNKPIYVGMCILDISKIRLYEFHYEYMLPLYRDKCKIMYTDTDSLIYRVECEDIYENMKRDIDKFDTSDYAMDNAYGMPLVNKKNTWCDEG